MGRRLLPRHREQWADGSGPRRRAPRRPARRPGNSWRGRRSGGGTVLPPRPHTQHFRPLLQTYGFRGAIHNDILEIKAQENTTLKKRTRCISGHRIYSRHITHSGSGRQYVSRRDGPGLTLRGSHWSRNMFPRPKRPPSSGRAPPTQRLSAAPSGRPPTPPAKVPISRLCGGWFSFRFRFRNRVDFTKCQERFT